MTTEDDFHTALDATPGDWQTRLVFADWLEDRGDPRAAGYRALGRLRVRGMPCQISEGPLRYILGMNGIDPKSLKEAWRECLLPDDWFALVELSPDCDNRHDKWKYYATRREAEDAAALAFATLPARRRADFAAPAADSLG